MALATRLVAIVLVVPCAGAQAADACGCPDVPDLLNRIAVAHAAIDKLTFELPDAGSTTKSASSFRR
jgi:hypothetical protein